jgi:hypothetical protein
LIFYYGAALVRYGDFTVEDIMSVFSVLLFSIAYASMVMTWSKRSYPPSSIYSSPNQHTQSPK